MIDYLLCGWHVRSAMQLPELPAWPGGGGVEGENTPDVEIGWEQLPPPPAGAPPMHVESDGTTLIAIPEVGRFLVRDGRRIGIEPSPPVDEAGIRLYLLGTVLAVLCYQRGVVPLHGSCLVPDPGTALRAVIVSGDSGVGKSTLAATLALRGTPILADDVCVLNTTFPSGPCILPSVSRLKLWRDTLHRLNIPVDDRHRVRDGIDKYAWYDVPATRTEATPLAAVYCLTREMERPSSETPLEALSGVAAIKVLSSCIYRGPIGVALGQESLIATTLMRILASVPLFRISHAPESDGPNPLPERLLAHWRTLTLC